MVRTKGIINQIGRRGAFLLFLALLDISYGYSLFVTEAPQRIFDLVIPWQAWGVIWMSVGFVCLTGVAMIRDRWQFAIAAVLYSAWGAVNLDLWLIQGVPRGWLSVAIWWSFAATVLLVSGWPDPPVLVTPPPKIEGCDDSDGLGDSS